VDAGSGLTVGAISIVTDVGTFNALEYVEYEFLEGDITYAGTWSVKLTTQDTGNGTCKSTDIPLTFEVGK